MVWLHTYSGLILGWLMYVIWVTGTLSYFNPEISRWMKPELPYTLYNTQLINQSLEKLNSSAPNADRWRIFLPNDRSGHWYIESRHGKQREKMTLGTSGAVEIRDTKGGNFFRTFHYTLMLRDYGGRYFAGLAAFIFLVAIFSGIYTHRRILKNFFTLRFNNTVQALKDSHALIGIITLPFNVMICFSALLIYTLKFMPITAEQFYEGGERAVFKEITPALPQLPKEVNHTPTITDFAPIDQQLKAIWSEDTTLSRLTIENPNKENGRIIAERYKSTTVSRQADRLVFSAHSGELIEGYQEESIPAKTRRVFWGLHEALFATPLLRALLFLLGLLSCAMVATGLIYWLKVREKKHAKQPNKPSLFWVNRLNVATITGLPFAICCYFLANRLIPIEHSTRATFETNLFLWAWLLSLIHALCRSKKTVWLEQLSGIALILFLIPLIDIAQNPLRMIEALSTNNTVYWVVPSLMWLIAFSLTGVLCKRYKQTLARASS